MTTVAGALPPGMTCAAAAFQASLDEARLDAPPRRRSLLEDALDRTQGLVFHPIRSVSDEDES